MSLIFEEDLSGGNAGNFDVEVIGDGISYAGGEAAITVPVVDQDTYIQCDSAIPDSTPHIHVKFDCKLDDLTLASTNRGIGFFSIYDATQQVIWMELKDADLDGDVDSVRLQYQRNGTNYSEIFPISIVDNTYSTFEVFFQEQYSTNDSGRFRLKIDDTKIIDITLSDQHTARRYCDKISFGNDTGSNTALERTLYFKNVLISPSSAFESGVSEYYVDNLIGDDGATGSASDPLKNAGNIMKTLVAGDTLKLVNNGESNPHRLSPGNNGAATVVTSGTNTAYVTVESDTGKACITRAQGVGDGQKYQWNESLGANGEYYVTLTDGGDPSLASPLFIATGNQSDDFDALRRVFANSETAGSISAAGEFAYGDAAADSLGFNTVYYKPLSSESVAIALNMLRGEVYSAGAGISFATDYTIVKNIKPRMCGTGIQDSGSSAGSYIIYNDSGYNGIYGLQSDGGAATIALNETHNNQEIVQGGVGDSGGGLALTGGSSSIAYGNYSHDNADDGCDIEGVGTATQVFGNRFIDNGYNKSDGCGIEIAANVAAIQTICANEFSGNNNRGLSIADDLAHVVKNNNFHDEGSIGLWIADNYGANLDVANNNFYNNATDVRTGGTGSYTPVNDTAVDPDLDSDGVPSSTSDLIGAGVKWWSGSRPIGSNGEPYPDWDIDIGGAQSKHSIHHPSNL